MGDLIIEILGMVAGIWIYHKWFSPCSNCSHKSDRAKIIRGADGSVTRMIFGNRGSPNWRNN